ncbi:MAG: TonB family protein [Pyrinomonadaceae bacterium]|nr:TonB family protein [Pyrinomonadaceae bacterium]
MPLNVRRFCTSVFLVLGIWIVGSHAQTLPQQATTPSAPTSGDVMRDRIAKAKAFIAVRNYTAASYELENIRKETGDVAVQSVVSVLLINSYLEQGDYKRAQEFLNESYNLQKTTKPNAAANYMAVASQVTKNARDRAERYRTLGLSVADRTLPLEALNDLEKMRETLEIVVTQSKEIGKSPIRTAQAMALLEEATNSRSLLARDDYDSRRWKDEVTDTREQMANARSVVLDAENGTAVTTAPTELTAANTAAAKIEPPIQSVAMREREVKTSASPPAETTVVANDKPVYVPSPSTVPAKLNIETPKSSAPKPIVTEPVAASGPLEVGSLLEFATDRTSPTYPPIAKMQRMTGIVRVDLTVNEEGKVDEVQKMSGPLMLQVAAERAIKKWRFKPFMRDGQPVKAIGFVSFNFDL